MIAKEEATQEVVADYEPRLRQAVSDAIHYKNLYNEQVLETTLWRVAGIGVACVGIGVGVGALMVSLLK